MELAARAMGQLAWSFGATIAEYVNFEMRRAFDSLASQDRNEMRKLAAVSEILPIKFLCDLCDLLDFLDDEYTDSRVSTFYLELQILYN